MLTQRTFARRPLGIAICTLAAVGAFTTAAAAKKTAKKGGLLYVAFVDTDDPRTAGLIEVLEQEVFVAAQLVLSTHESVYRDVTSRRRIELERGSVVDSLLEFQQYVSLGMRDQVNRIRGQLRLAVTDFLVIKVLATGAETVRVDMELRSLEDWRLVQMKTIGACAMTVADVSGQVRSVIGDIVSGRDDRPARAVATATPRSPVRLGTSISLDGCESLDPDWDTLEWKWKTVVAPTGAEPLPAAGFVGKGFEFTPREAGRYEFELNVARVVDGRTAPASRISIDVVRPPWADAGPDRLVETLGQRLDLDGSHSGPLRGPEGSTHFQWRQTQGATVTLQRLDPEGHSQSFVAQDAGLFAFELTVSNPVGTATDVVTFLVAPPPAVDPGPDMKTHPHHKTRLNGRGSFDLIDPSPKYLWTLETPSKHAHILGAHSVMPTFVATEAGTYRVRLRVRARRDLGDERRWAIADDTVTIEVVRPSMTLYARTTTTIRFREDNTHFRSDDTASHSFLFVGVGLLYAPSWFPQWLGVRFAQNILRMRLDPVGREDTLTSNVSREPEFSGGGGVGPEFSTRWGSLSTGLFLGVLYKIGGSLRAGFTAGGFLQWRIFHGVVIKAEIGYDGFVTFSDSLDQDVWIHAPRGSLAFGLEL